MPPKTKSKEPIKQSAWSDPSLGTQGPQERALAPALYLVPTPIGNLGDITQRAIEVLRSADVIAAEDTRHSQKLLLHLALRKKMIACHDHNEADVAQKLISAVQKGQRVAMISDAGTPLLADPGYRIVQAAIDAGILIVPLPGPNALLPALQLAGLPPAPFYFVGFLPPKSKARRDVWQSLSPLSATLIAYETPHRLAESLTDAAAVLGARPAAVVREISKIHEEARRGDLENLAAHYAQHPARGEIVIVIGGAPDENKALAESVILAALQKALRSGASLRDAVDLIAAQTGQPRRTIYDLALKLKADAGKN